MRKLWDGDSTKFRNWLKVELAVLKARGEKLKQIPQDVPARIRKKLRPLTNPLVWPKVVAAIQRRDEALVHDLNAFLDIMRAAIILPFKEFMLILNCPAKSADDKEDEVFNQMVDAALARGKENLDAGFFHDGLTSYDTEEAAMAMLFWESYKLIAAQIALLIKVLIMLAKKYRHTVMLGRTHGQPAQPITFGAKCLNWLEMIRAADKALRRLARDYRVMKLSGAVGMYGALGPEVEREVGKILKLKPASATQILRISYRARIISEMAILSQELRKIATDLRIMMRGEVGEAQEAFKRRQKGSSAMMGKKNPILTERVWGLASVLLGCSVAINDVIATSEERDIAHSSVERVILTDAFAVMHYQLWLLTDILETMQVFPERMRENLDANLGAFAVQKLEMLLKKKGMSAEEVYRILQAACFTATERRWHLENIVLNSAHECARPILELIDGGALSIKEVQAVFDVEEWIKEEPHLYERAGIAA